MRPDMLRVPRLALAPAPALPHRLDLAPAAAAFRRFGDAARDVARAIGRSLEVLTGVLRRAREARVSGLEARYYVRGGFGLPDVVHLDALVGRVLAGRAPGTLTLSRAHRSRVAAALVRGWVEHVPGEPAPSMAWHRRLAGVSVSVGRCP